MGGAFSRNKGARVERLIIDNLRKIGYTAYRVPLSGASMGDKGDIKVEIPNSRYGDRPMDAKFLYGEAKARGSDFDRIYVLFDSLRGMDDTTAINYGDTNIVISHRFDALGLIGSGDAVDFKTFTSSFRGVIRTIQKLCNLKELLKGCDFLVLKGNNKPLLYVRYY